MHNPLWFQGVETRSRQEIERILRESDISVMVSPENSYALERGISPIICIRKGEEGYGIMPLDDRVTAQYSLSGKTILARDYLANLSGQIFRLCDRYIPWIESDELLAQTFFNDPHFTKQ